MSGNSLPNLIEFSGAKIRLVGSVENPEWVAADVCAVLGLSDVSMSLKGFKASEKGTSSICTPEGGIQEMLTITEPGLYRLIFKSRKPEADRFRTWVTHEVLPSLRQHGCYPAPLVEVSSTALVAIDAQQLCIQLGRSFSSE